jgi:hypothetical protein
MDEQQIQRYGRQILLREVGGRGQTKLLTRPVRVEGASQALDVAAAYLAAGGTAIGLPTGHAPWGFLQGTALGDYNPDAAAGGAPWLVLGAKPSPAPGLQVVVGAASVTWGNCPACVALGAALPDPAAAEPVTLGALAALVVQRLALDLGEPSGRLEVTAGVPAEAAAARCPNHPNHQ